jgi:hypothetical protein
MSARQPALSVSMQQQDAIERNNRRLLHALQTAHPVQYQGVNRFIHTLKFETSGGSIETTVYLTGEPTAIPGASVTVKTE